MSNTQHRTDEDNDESYGAYWSGRVGDAKHLPTPDKLEMLTAEQP
jgi:hypothetical protein